MTASDSSTLTACAATVAAAAPATPMPAGPTSSQSPAMFTAQAIATDNSGIRELPMPRKTLPSTLYATMNGAPALQIFT